jgi:type I restriction enzyme S subunit
MNLAEADLTQAIEKKMDRSNWKTWKFSDLVENIVEKVVPKESLLEHYIGLKHLDSGSLHIRRFGESASIEGDKLKIYKGDFIFAKRNSYLKRVAIAKFDAVASAHALVLRARPENVLPEFLPFFLLSEKFWERAIEISVGSLSPTINWRVLAKQEFLLPPKAQQAEIAKLLWAMDEVIQNKIDVIEHLSESKSSIQRSHFDRTDVSFVAIDDCAQVYSGGTPNRKKSEFWGGGVPWAKTAEVNYERILTTEESITEMGLNGSAAKLVPENSILLAMYGQGVTRGRVALTGIPLTCNQACAVIQPNVDYRAAYIYSYLEYKYEDLRSLAHGANQQNLNLRMVKSFLIPKADLDEQRSVVHELQTVDGCLSEFRVNVESSKSFQKSLINQVF